ncbi:MAG: rod shape-determining protein RodA [Candidatus Kerfeldbacteria bacterium]
MASFTSIRLFRRFDWLLLGATILLVAIGIATLYSITLNVELPRIDKFYRQLISFGIGLVLLLFVVSTDFRKIRSYAWVLYGVSLGFLSAVLILGTTIRGTTGWFALFGSTFQPVEIVKVLLVIVLARYFAEHVDEGASWRVIRTSGALVAAPTLLVVLQPDLGSAALLIGVWLGMLLFLKIPLRRFVTILVGIAVVACIGWFGLADYQRERVLTFLNPTRDPLRSGYNVRQAIVAIGSGKLFGRGLGLGTQSQLNFLPTQDTDFIFSVIAEELGFVGTAVLLGLFGIFLSRFIRGISRGRDIFGNYLLAGIATLFSLEIVLNIGGNLGLLPLTGIPLPFLSYGGSALISSILAVGVALSVLTRSSSY